MVHSDRPKHAYLSPMPDSRIRSRRGLAAGGNGVWGEEPTLCNAPGATLGRSTIYLIIIILFISLLASVITDPFALLPDSLMSLSPTEVPFLETPLTAFVETYSGCTHRFRISLSD